MVASHRYEVRVAGVVPPDVVLDFDHLRISVEPVVTVICESLPDQAALYALLDRLEKYHVQLLEFRRCHGATCPRCPRADPHRVRVNRCRQDSSRQIEGRCTPILVILPSAVIEPPTAGLVLALVRRAG
jgi:hypothetical protein